MDPFGQYNDADLWKALEDVHLKDKLMSTPETAEKGLEFEFSEGDVILLAVAIQGVSQQLTFKKSTVFRNGAA